MGLFGKKTKKDKKGAQLTDVELLAQQDAQMLAFAEDVQIDQLQPKGYETKSPTIFSTNEHEPAIFIPEEDSIFAEPKVDSKKDEVPNIVIHDDEEPIVIPEIKDEHKDVSASATNGTTNFGTGVEGPILEDGAKIYVPDVTPKEVNSFVIPDDLQIKIPNEFVKEETPKVNEEVNEEVKEDQQITDMLIAETAKKRFVDFVESEPQTAELNKKIDSMKMKHKKDYDKYVEELRKTPAYKEAYAKWKKYYEDLRLKYVDEAKKELTPPNTTNETKDKMQHQAQVNGESGKGDEQAVAKRPSAKVSTQSMALDKTLKDNVMQILIGYLHDSIDENRDKYTKEQALLGKSSVKSCFKQINETRTAFSEALCVSFAKVFDLTQNKRIKRPYEQSISSMQQTIKSKSQNNQVDVQTSADMTMDSFIHYDLQTKEMTGIIPEVAELLAMRVQEQLLKHGVVKFDLSKKEILKMLNEISTQSHFASQKTSMLAGDLKSDKQTELILKFQQAYDSIKSCLDGSTQLKIEDVKFVKEAIIHEYPEAYKLISSKAQVSADQLPKDYEVCQKFLAMYETLSKIAFETKKLDDSRYAYLHRDDKNINASLQKQYLRDGKLPTKEQIDALTSSVGKQKSALTRMLGAEKRWDLKTLASFEKSCFKVENGQIVEKGDAIKAILDCLVEDGVKHFGSVAVKDGVSTFAITEEVTEAQKKDMIDVFNSSRDTTFTLDDNMLQVMICRVHDLRESNISPENKQKAQNLLNEMSYVLEHLESEDLKPETITAMFNDYIEMSPMMSSTKVPPKQNTAKQNPIKTKESDLVLEVK